MTVFISYRHTDLRTASTINDVLNAAGITTYLDKLDAESQTTEDITSVITRKIAQSSHLIAVVSAQTALSWWVPFEIGEATIVGRRIVSFHTGGNRLPEYLDKWPQMNNMGHLQLFIQAYKNDSRLFVANESAGNESFITRRSNADDFHRGLKSSISRGF